MKFTLDKTLKELELWRDIAFKEIDECPFLLKEWSALDKLFAKLFNYKLPLPQTEFRKLKIQVMYDDQKKDLEDYMHAVQNIEI